MRIIRDYTSVRPEDRGASAAIGNFDGVHRGHQSVIALAWAQAARHGHPLGVLTFEPHPRQIFAPDTPPFRLMNAEARANRLARLGVDCLYEIGFTRALAALSARDFARTVLCDGLGISHAVVGADFRFGKGREGDADILRALGREMGFGVTIAPLIHNGTDEISSTAIRRALSEGRPRDAAQMLGHWHRIEGEVLHGAKRGRDLGFPTANMSITDLHPPRLGVYAVKVDVLTGPQAGSYGGAASIGVRPMFGENLPNLEVHLFDFSGDLYGQHLSIALIDWLRPEEKFATLTALTDQMQADCAQARAILAAL